MTIDAPAAAPLQTSTALPRLIKRNTLLLTIAQAFIGMGN